MARWTSWLCALVLFEPFVNPFLSFSICLSHHLFFQLPAKTLLLFHSTKRVQKWISRTIGIFLNWLKFLEHLNSLLLLTGNICAPLWYQRVNMVLIWLTIASLLELTSFVIDGLNKKIADRHYIQILVRPLLLIKLDQLGLPNNRFT